MEETARILEQIPNCVVVQLPGRRFRGVVVQGDTLAAMLSLADRACAPNGAEAGDSALMLRDQ